MTLRDSVLSLSARRPVTVGPHTVYVRPLTPSEAADLHAKITARKGDPDGGNLAALALVVVACTVDDTGEPLFTAADLPAVEKLPAVVLSSIFAEAADLNGFEEGVKRGKASSTRSRSPSGGSESAKRSAAR